MSRPSLSQHAGCLLVILWGVAGCTTTRPPTDVPAAPEVTEQATLPEADRANLLRGTRNEAPAMGPGAPGTIPLP